MKDKKYKLFLIFGIVLMIAALAGATYAFFSARVKGEGNINRITLGNFDVTFAETSNINVTTGMPIYDKDRATQAYKNAFTVRPNNADGCLTVKVDITSIENKFTLNESLKWELYDVTNSVSLGTGSFQGTSASSQVTLSSGIDIANNVTRQFEVRIWLSYIPDIDQSALITGNTGNAVEANLVFEASSGLCINQVAINMFDNSGANSPANNLVNGMIPVYYDESCITEDSTSLGCWKKAPTTQVGWYNYEESHWANAVTVSSTNRQNYMSASVGTEIPMSDINTMWVWIPRYEYYINGNYAGGTQALPNAININFIDGVSTNTTTNYVIPASFRNGTTYNNGTSYDLGGWDKELPGIWISKFEVGAATDNTTSMSCGSENCANADRLLIKPNISSQRTNNVSSFFYALRSMQRSGNPYGFDVDGNIHMIKSDEWGSVLYLMQSIYGICESSTNCKEVMKNNSSSYYTGRSEGVSTPTNGYSSYGTYSYDGYLMNENTKTVTRDMNKIASTTGNIYGIYDMSGGSYEYVMGVLQYNNNYIYTGYDTASNSGFKGYIGSTLYINSSYLDLPEQKYFNRYTSTTYNTSCNGGICYGHGLSDTIGWYNDYNTTMSLNYPWLVKGYNYSSLSSGPYSLYRYYGSALSDFSTRAVVIP